MWLDGKKAVIGNILQTLNAILIATKVYNAEIGISIAALILALTGVGVAATNAKFGKSVRNWKP